MFVDSERQLRLENESLRHQLATLQDELNTYRRDHGALNRIAASVRCLIWHAQIEDCDGSLVWSYRYATEEAAQRLLPLPVGPEQRYHHVLLQRVVAEDRDRMEAYVDPHIRAGRDYTIEFRCHRADGEIRWLAEDVRVTPSGPARWSAVGICMDVTDRRRTEEALRKSEAFYYSLLENLPVAVYRKDVYGHYTFCNIRFAASLGATRDQVAGRTDRDFFPSEMAELFAIEDRSVMQSGELLEKCERRLPLHGPAQYVQVLKMPVRDMYGAVGGIQGVFWNDTERGYAEEELRASDERFRQMAEAIPDVFWICDASTLRITYVSPAYDELWGHSGDRLHSATFPFPDSVHPDDRELALDIRRKRTENVSAEYRVIRADGATRWVQDRRFVVRDETDKVLRFVGIVTDITDHRNAAADLQRRTLELTESNQALDQFAYTVSHDLQEPLRLISLYAQLLARRMRIGAEDENGQFISYIADGARHMHAMIKDLLALSRVATLNIDAEPIDCEQALSRAIANLGAAIEESGGVITHAPLPMIRADKTLLTLLFQNLIGNALKFRADRAPLIHIWAEPDESGLQFNVEDNGIGFEPKYADGIFTVFRRLQTGPEYPGTGVGLAICKRIVERHGGVIDVTSVPGVGSCFSFTLPQ